MLRNHDLSIACTTEEYVQETTFDRFGGENRESSRFRFQLRWPIGIPREIPTSPLCGSTNQRRGSKADSSHLSSVVQVHAAPLRVPWVHPSSISIRSSNPLYQYLSFTSKWTNWITSRWWEIHLTLRILKRWTTLAHPRRFRHGRSPPWLQLQLSTAGRPTFNLVNENEQSC